jgi:hypothetical protein
MSPIIAAASLLAASDASGVYMLEGVREMVSGFQLKPDHTYEFHLTYGAADYWSKGVWRIEDNAIVLATPGKAKGPFRLLKSEKKPAASADTDAIRVRVVAPNGRPVPNVRVQVQTVSGDHSTQQTDSEGIAYFQPDRPLQACAFEIRVYQLQTEPMTVNSSHNDFVFEINGEEITQIRFENERLQPAEGGFLLRHFNPDHPLRYRKADPR